MTIQRAIVLPSDPFNPHNVDEAFTKEASVVRWNETLVSILIDHDELQTSGNLKIKGDSYDSPVEGVYRGWMVAPSQYEVFYAALKSHNIILRTTPTMFRKAHMIDGWVEALKGLTPDTVLLGLNPSVEEILNAGISLASESFFVKDYVKARKHEWAEACYAPTLDVLPTIVKNMITLQEEYLTGGVAIREFIHFDKKVEIRYWWVKGEFVTSIVHPDFAGKEIVSVPEEFLIQVNERLNTLDLRYLAVDFAKTVDGKWYVVEIGDGQVSGFPNDLDDETVEKVLTS